jgi:hypothetical protein
MRRFDHIDLRVKEMGAAKLFYGRLLPELGFTISSISDEWCIWQTPGTGPVEFFSPPRGIISLTITGSRSGRKAGRRSIGLPKSLGKLAV